MPKHLLWACLFLKTYCNETVLSALTSVDEKAQRYYVWKVIKALARLRIVIFFLFLNFYN